ncbi:glycoside hydrolase family 32 protein [Rhizobium sp. BR 249]|uniref:glycoside hydrolase family 32 protein n=1 Tax=Rhizobium sp. BR 249 TaxID=3040011 RepID=UPI0039BF756A
MSTSLSEKFRPKLHLTAKYGWINDPNGLICVDGVYHAFYQHDPNSIRHGPMHWGHASSRDLVNWIQHEVALFPDENGTCFSGCAVETEEGQIKLIYTSHRFDEAGRDFQQQSLVHADRSLSKFEKEPSNPVIKNSGLGCFRDPKVFWHGESGRWIMALAHGATVGQSIGFHSSVDLNNWTFESEFGNEDGRHGSGPWECPDLLPMVAPDGSKHWILVAGIGDEAYAPGSGTMYFIGQFDGKTFTNSNPRETELWLDYGRDYYAAQSFFGAHKDAPLALAWSNNWKYSQQTPMEEFSGLMSLPRHLRLVETPDGLRLGSFVPDAVSGAFPTIDLSSGQAQPPSGTYRLEKTVSLAPGSQVALSLFSADRPQFTFLRDENGRTRIRQVRDAYGDMNEFAHDYDIEAGDLGTFTLEVFVDNGLVELNLDKIIWTTNVYYPDTPGGAVALTGI